MTANDDALNQARALLSRHFGYDRFLPGQEEALRSILAGRNLVAVMPTGSGKSLLYQLPALMTDGLTLVVSPLIALMKDQVDELQRRGYPATFINSSLGPDEQRRRIDACIEGQVRLLYVAPERFQVQSFLDMLTHVKIGRLAVDEAHCISQWGHDFRPDYRRIKEFRQRMGSPLVSALTATATPRVQRDILDCLGLQPDEVDVHVHGFDRPNLHLSVVRAGVDAEKADVLNDLLRHEPGAGIVYVGTRKAAESVAADIMETEPATTIYHAGLLPEERTRAQEEFLSGRTRVVVATVAFGMGIDKPDVRFVVHYHYPGSVEAYYQEIGRAGRDGLPSRCVLLHSWSDHYLREFFIDLNYPGPEVVNSVYNLLWRVDENPVMMTYNDIAELCDGSVKAGQVGAAVRLLDQAGLTRAAGETTVGIGFDQPGPRLRELIHGPTQLRVLESLATSVDLEVPGCYNVSLQRLCAAAGLDDSQVRRALAAMAEAGHIQYEPPFRGRGVLKVVPMPPRFDELDIDWDHQKLLRGLEEEKLQAIEDFIESGACRRAFILRYFGETSDLVCGECDNCRAGGGKRAKGRGVAATHPEIAVSVLACVRALKFPLGVDNIVGVVTGSRAKRLLEWRLDRNPAYGTVSAKREVVKRVVEKLLDEGCLARTGDRTRPVIELTARGEEALENSPEPHEPTAPAPSASVDRLARDPDVRRAVLSCVRRPELQCGVSGVAQLLTGSTAKWIADAGADRLDLYGTVDASQRKLKDLIGEMKTEGLLRTEAGARYPVLRLTPAGQAELAGFQAPAPAAPSRPEPAPAPPVPPLASPPPQDAPPSAVAATLDALIDGVLVHERDEARALVADLRLFHPGEICARLGDRFRSPRADERQRMRAVWAVGELAGVHGLDFLIDCTRSENGNIRRLAASALGKVAQSLPADPAPTLVAARQALEALLTDPAPQVRQCAAKSLPFLRG